MSASASCARTSSPLRTTRFWIRSSWAIAELWRVKQERDRIYALPEMSEDDGMKVADLEVQFAETGRLYCRSTRR